LTEDGFSRITAKLFNMEFKDMTALSPRLSPDFRAYTSIEIVDRLAPADLHDLCEATERAIEPVDGFGWVTPPAREVMERYWRGVMLVPERHLLVARMDGMICGAAQLVTPTKYNEAQAFAANLLACFIAPWARGRGAGRRLIETTEKLAQEMGFNVLQLDLRDTQQAGMQLCEKMGYKRWGTNPNYALVNKRMIAGHFYNKVLRPPFTLKEVSAA
jgi:GNAT superfamily N-acetyltransferase